MYPHGLEAIRKEYWDPRRFTRSDGTVHVSWEDTILQYLHLPEPLPLGWDKDIQVSRIRVHYKLTHPLSAIFAEIYDAGLWPKLKTYDGAYSWRAKRAGQKLSTHAWGIALDFNAETNQLGTKGDMPEEIVQIFEKHGWEWGGRWEKPDPMHFQACHGY